MKKDIKTVFRRLYNFLRYNLLRIVTGGRVNINPVSISSTGSRVYAVCGGSVKIGSMSHFENNTQVKASSGHITIGNNVYLNRGVVITAKGNLTIGSKVTIGPNTCIFDHDHAQNCEDGFTVKDIVIEDNVWIGASCVILKGVTIGKNSTVAAGSVVTKDIPSNTVFCQKREDSIKEKQ